MKLTLEEVLSGFIVLHDYAEYVTAHYATKGEVTLLWGDVDSAKPVQFDNTQIVEADGDRFTATDATGRSWSFVAMKAVRLNEIPELR